MKTGLCVGCNRAVRQTEPFACSTKTQRLGGPHCSRALASIHGIHLTAKRERFNICSPSFGFHERGEHSRLAKEYLCTRTRRRISPKRKVPGLFLNIIERCDFMLKKKKDFIVVRGSSLHPRPRIRRLPDVGIAVKQPVRMRGRIAVEQANATPSHVACSNLLVLWGLRMVFLLLSSCTDIALTKQSGSQGLLHSGCGAYQTFSAMPRFQEFET